MKAKIKFLEKESRKGYRIGKAFYSKENMQKAVMEANLILSKLA